ncbi:SPFH domain-containing protein [Moritella sp. 36]|uniref:SPFH domain-containing protein n=1 Tax=Moritella sp. 36 TaxID=2746233 RepID=UPI001BA6315D|nr:SPFH domain-containing protein [Moritella sp. 36]QUM88850.1 SPFH domain-containing protein [Moritella sp. 36]
MESALVLILDKIPSWLIWFIPIVWLIPKIFGLRVVRRTHGGVKFTNVICWRYFLKRSEWSLLPPFVPHEDASVLEIKPGVCIYNKLLTDIELYPTARQTSNLQYQALVTKDNRSIAVSTIIAFEVTDIVKAYGETWDMEDLIKDISLAKVRQLLTSMLYDDIIKNQAQIDDDLTVELKMELCSYGVEVIKAYFTDLAPSGNTFFMNSENSNLIPMPENT